MPQIIHKPQSAAALPEAGTWSPFPGGWRQLYGGFAQLGVSMEFHDFTPQRDLDWARSFHPGSVEICLNLEGSATLGVGDQIEHLGPSHVAVYAVGETLLRAIRVAGQRHRFVTVEMTSAFLHARFPTQREGLLPLILAVLGEPGPRSAVGLIRQFTPAQSAALRIIAQPPVHPLARPLWYEARLCEWMSECLFSPEDELFCHRQQRTERERVERVKAILAEQYTEPPTLAELARKVGMSSFYLSRTFSRVAGETIAQHIRRLRIERAAELLRKGTHNVTEAAFAVGYSSLGHFARNFAEVLGTPPLKYATGDGK